MRFHPDEHQGPFGHLRQLFTVILRSEAGEGSLGKKRRVRRQDFLEFRQSRAESLRILFRCNDGNSECLCPLQQNFDPGQDLFAPFDRPAETFLQVDQRNNRGFAFRYHVIILL